MNVRASKSEKKTEYNKMRWQRLKDNPEEYEAYKEKKRLYAKTYRQQREVKDRIHQSRVKWSKKNQDKERMYRQKGYLKSKKEKSIYAVKYVKARKQTDPVFKLKVLLRTRIARAFKMIGLNKKTKTHLLLGCDYLNARRHIELQFKEGMGWDNYTHSIWHIDHIIPLSSAKNEKELINLCHYTNLQPLWAKENFQKSNKII